jgi:signal transduction histidine kinase
MEAIFADKDKKPNIGLHGMKERAELSNGTFVIDSEEGRGTVVRAFWPID